MNLSTCTYVLSTKTILNKTVHDKENGIQIRPAKLKLNKCYTHIDTEALLKKKKTKYNKRKKSKRKKKRKSVVNRVKISSIEI